MEPFADADDIVAVWQPLSASESAAAGGLLAQASTKLRVLVPNIDAVIGADSTGIKAALAQAAVVNAVKRVFLNPEALLSETIDDYSWRRDSAVSSGALYIDAGDLLGFQKRTNRKFGSISLRRAF